MRVVQRYFLAFLAISVFLTSLFVPMAVASDECTIETAGNAVRIIPENTSFAKDTVREFTFTVPEAGDYAVFFSQTAEKNDFTVTFSPANGEAVTYSSGGAAAQNGYGYGYIRVGAAGGLSASAKLPAGECTIAVTPTAADAVIQYIDVRCTTIFVDGSKQAIYPSDYNKYANVGSPGHVNGMVSGGNPRVPGYAYVSDYNSATFSDKRSDDRYIHINGGTTVTYQIDVEKTGTYLLTVDQMFYSYNAKADQGTENRTGSMVLSLDGDQVYTKSDEIVVAGNGGTTDNGTREWHSITLDMTEGIHEIAYKMNGLGAYLYHITLEEKVEYGDKVVAADNNLTRIEVGENAKIIAGGTTRDFSFTVPVTGSYHFATQHPKTYSGTLAASVRNLSTLESVQFYNGTWTDDQNNTYAKIGDSSTAPVVLEANIPYVLSITPEADMTVDYIDIFRVDLPVNGKTAIVPYYITSSNLSLTHLNCDDVRNTVIPLDGHKLVGDYTSELLATPSEGTPLGIYMNNQDYYVTYTLDVQSPGYYQFIVAAGQYQGETLTGKLDFAVDGVPFGSDEYHGSADNKNDTLVSPSVYLYSGKQTLTISNKKNNGCGMYVKYILAEPTTEGTAIADASVLPVALSPNLVADFTGELGKDGISLDNGEFVSWNVSAEEFSANLNYTATVPVGAQMTCQVDGEVVSTVSLSEKGALFEGKAFSDGTHTVTITSQADGVVLKTLNLTECKTAVEVLTGSIRTKTDLTMGSIQEGSGSLEASSGTLNESSSYMVTYNIADGGYYTVYVSAVMEQCSFKAYFDDKEVTNDWYWDTGNDNVNNAKNQQDKKLALPIYLESGTHTFVLEIMEGYTAKLVSQLELRRVDGPAYAQVSEGERIVTGWDFTAENLAVPNWYFSQQYDQGSKLTDLKGYEGFTVRNAVVDNTSSQGFTYTVTVPEDGYYDLGLYCTATVGTVLIFTVDEGMAVELPETKDSGVIHPTTAKPVFLAEGMHTITVRMKTSGKTLRINALSIARANIVEVDAGNKTVCVTLGLSDAVNGKIITAFYSGEELVGIDIFDAAGTRDVEVTVTNLPTVPDCVKVMNWKDLENVEPISKALSYNATSAEWIVINEE